MSTLRIPTTSGANSGTFNAAKGALAGAGAGAAVGSSSSTNKAAPKSYPFWLGGAYDPTISRLIWLGRLTCFVSPFGLD